MAKSKNKKTRKNTVDKNKHQLDVLRFALATGITWAIVIFSIAIFAMIFGKGERLIEIIADVYWGYSSSVMGAILGGIWAFMCGFGVGAMFSYLYTLKI